jgi:hypothetical protein
MTEKISFKMLYQEDLGKFVKYWSNLINMTEEDFKKECIIESDSLLSDNEFDEIYGSITK